MESLAALLDTDKETVDRRNRVFADLLGVRSHLDAQDRLRKYDKALQPNETELEAQVRSRQVDLERMRGEQGSGDSETTSSTQWGMAEELLGITSGEASVERAEIVAGEIARRAQTLLAMRQALTVVERDPVQLPALRRQLEEEVARGQAAATAAEAARARLVNLRELRGVAAAAAQAATRANDRVNEVTEAFSRLLDALSAAVDALDPEEGVPSRPTYDLVADRIPEIALTARRRRQLSSDVAQLTAGFPDFARHVGERRDLRAAVDKLRAEIPDADARSRLAAAAAEAEEALVQARSRVAADSEAVQRLQAAGEAFLTHSHDGADCPVCGHDWETRSALDAAIKTVVDRMPTVLADARRDITGAEEAASQARRRVSDADGRVGDLAKLEAERDDLAGRVSAYEARLRAVGVDPAEPDPTARLRRMKARLDAARTFSEAEDARSKDVESLGLSFDRSLPLLDAKEVLQGQADERCVAELRMAANHQVEVERLDTSIAEAERDGAGQETDREDSHDLAAGLRQRVDALAEAWRKLDLADATPATDGASISPAVARVAERLGREEDALSQARSRLAAGNAAAEQANRRRRLAEVEAEVADLVRRLEGVRRRRAVAGRAMAAMQAHYLGAGRRQLDDLIRSVNPLFARMHANKVFDSVELGEGDDLLRWRSTAGDQPFDPAQDFSQGQRQDLALALFIARARGLRGTFFLDEPVTHLDDLNRVGLLDVLRATVLSSQGSTRLVVTTSSRSMARHVMEKFDRVAHAGEGGAADAAGVRDQGQRPKRDRVRVDLPAWGVGADRPRVLADRAVLCSVLIGRKGGVDVGSRGHVGEGRPDRRPRPGGRAKRRTLGTRGSSARRRGPADPVEEGGEAHAKLLVVVQTLPIGAQVVRG